MSLVSTCVQANDGKIYKNPILSGEDFFICFDDDDPPELVIKRLHRIDSDLHKRALDILKNLGLVASLRGNPMKSSRLFNLTQELSTKFIEAISYFLHIEAPIPANHITKHDGLYDGQSECTLYRWPEKLKEISPQNDGQRYWPSHKPSWMPKHTHKKSEQPPTPPANSLLFMKTTSGNKIAAQLIEVSTNGYSLLIYNPETHLFDRPITVTDLSQIIE